MPIHFGIRYCCGLFLGLLLLSAVNPKPAIESRVESVEAVEKGPGKRLLVKFFRERASQELQKNGFSSVGGSSRPLSKAEAEARLSRLDDDQIATAAIERGKLGDGAILKRLLAVWTWIVTHKEEIAEVVKFILSLLLLFGDDVG